MMGESVGRTMMRVRRETVEDTVKVPGFGFLDRELWAGLEPLRRVSGGNLSDEEVCGKITESWLEERLASQEGLQEVQESCWPQWEGVVCVPSSRVGHQAVLPCMADYDGKNGHEFYDTSYNITKNCLATTDSGPDSLGGSWENYTNYSQCLANTIHVEEWPENVFLVGYTVSLLSLLLAIFIFIYFRELVCLRHRIHTHLFCSLLATSLTWILSWIILKLVLVPSSSGEGMNAALSTIYCILSILLRYFQLSIFFWMFVEGLYLFLQVQASFSFGNLKLRHCVSIGWGSPLLLALLWTLLVYCQSASSRRDKEYEPGTEALAQLACPFLLEPSVPETLLYTLPICLLLICNTAFLIWIMGVVVSKLRSNVGHTSSANLRAAKALLIIVPLLGITYLITLRNPFSEGTLERTIFKFITHVLISFQGFFISLPYCFLNSEVSQMVKNQWGRWRNNRDIGTAPQSARNSIATQGFIGVCEGLNRTRSYTYQTVRNSLVPLDRRGTDESLGRTARAAQLRLANSSQLGTTRRDGPLVPQPDLVTSNRGDTEMTEVTEVVKEEENRV